MFRCMDIRERQVGELTVVELVGRITVNDDPGLLKEAVANVVRQGARNVLVDLSGVHYIDSTRLEELIAAHVTVSRQGGRLKLLKTPQRVVELLLLAGLGDVFERFAICSKKRPRHLSSSPLPYLSPRPSLPPPPDPSTQLAVELEQRRRVVAYHLDLRHDLPQGLFFFHLFGDEPLQLGHGREDLLLKANS